MPVPVVFQDSKEFADSEAYTTRALTGCGPGYGRFGNKDRSWIGTEKR